MLISCFLRDVFQLGDRECLSFVFCHGDRLFIKCKKLYHNLFVLLMKSTKRRYIGSRSPSAHQFFFAELQKNYVLRAQRWLEVASINATGLTETRFTETEFNDGKSLGRLSLTLPLALTECDPQ